MPDMKNPRPGAGPGTGAKTTGEDVRISVVDQGGMPHGRAYAGPPCPGRGLWAITVLACPHCGGMHQHRSGQAARLLSGRITRLCPTTGRAYVLAPVQRRRDARRG